MPQFIISCCLFNYKDFNFLNVLLLDKILTSIENIMTSVASPQDFLYSKPPEISETYAKLQESHLTPSCKRVSSLSPKAKMNTHTTLYPAFTTHNALIQQMNTNMAGRRL